MKKIFILALLPIVFSFSQSKFGYVDSDAIMKNFVDAQDARSRLDQLVQEWQSELTRLENEYQSKLDDFEKRKLIMSDQVRADIEQELAALEKQKTDYRDKKFGTNGELFAKQDELMKPVQNKVFNAIKEVAQNEELDFVFDRSGDIMILYAKDEFDITAKVLERLKLE